jgi:hypothetical protein
MKRRYHGPLALLLDEAGRVFGAAVDYAAQLVGRLDPSRVAQWQTDLGTLKTASTTALTARGELGSLTVAQNAAIKEVRRHLSDARKFAKRAFAGQHVKLNDQFQVGADDHGVHTQHDLAAYKQRARVVVANCREIGNAAALLAKGWLATDTDALQTSLGQLFTTDDTQELSKGESAGDTAAVVTAANAIWDAVVDVQTIAGRVFPDNSPANVEIRNAFRLGIYPPATHSNGGDGTTPPATALTAKDFPVAAANGILKQVGTFNGKPLYQTAGGWFIGWMGATPWWAMQPDDPRTAGYNGVYYRADENVAGQYVTGGTSNPAGTVS